MELACSAMGLPAAGGVQHLAPKVMQKFVLADGLCDRCARAHVKSNAQRVLTACVKLMNSEQHVQRYLHSTAAHGERRPQRPKLCQRISNLQTHCKQSPLQPVTQP